jgi:hypothetical protein
MDELERAPEAQGVSDKDVIPCRECRGVLVRATKGTCDECVAQMEEVRALVDGTELELRWREAMQRYVTDGDRAIAGLWLVPLAPVSLAEGVLTLAGLRQYRVWVERRYLDPLAKHLKVKRVALVSPREGLAAIRGAESEA